MRRNDIALRWGSRRPRGSGGAADAETAKLVDDVLMSVRAIPERSETLDEKLRSLLSALDRAARARPGAFEASRRDMASIIARGGCAREQQHEVPVTFLHVRS
jgi:hypothetical protein